MEDIVLVGFGGHAKSVADCIERGNKYRIAGYTDFLDNNSCYKYLGTDEVLYALFQKGIRNVTICMGYIGKGKKREDIYFLLKEKGFCFPTIIDPSAVVADSAEIGEGSFIGKGAIINADAKIGKMCIINTKALIEHECRIGDFSHIAVGAVLCGQVIVGKAAFVGANATVIQQRKIEERVIVPAGVTVR